MPQLSYCAGEVRRHDRDRFLCTLFAPADRRESLFALFAFNSEVARIRESVSEPLLGAMRLQWWRETVGRIFDGEAPAHEVARSLAETVRRFGLSREHFASLLDARAADLADQPPADADALIAYAEATSATLVRLALEILGLRDGVAHQAGRHVGIAWALTGLLRAVPFHARRRRVYLPAAAARQAGLDLDALFALRPDPRLAAVVGEIAAVARQHLEAARGLAREVPARGVPALLPATLAAGYLRRLGKAGFDPFSAGAEAAGPRLLAQLAVNAWRGRY